MYIICTLGGSVCSGANDDHFGAQFMEIVQ